MRIVILLRILWTGGAQKIAIREARELVRLGHEVALVFLRGHETVEYRELLRGLRYDIVSESGEDRFSPVYDFATRVFRPDRGRESRVDFNLLRAFPKYLRGRQVDLLICHDQWTGIAGYFARGELGVPYIVVMHERIIRFPVPILGRVASWYEWLVLGHAFEVVALTDKVSDSVVSAYHIPARTIMIGLDKREMTTYEQRKNALVACSFWDTGRLPLRYLSILNELKDFVLVFAGNWRDQRLRESFLSHARSLGLESRLVLAERMPESELGRIYQNSKFSLRFGYGEHGIGMSVMEAIENGVPIIMNRELGSAGIVDASGVGCVLDDPTPKSVASKVRTLDNARDFGAIQRRQQVFVDRFSWHAHAKALLRSCARVPLNTTGPSTSESV